MDRTPRAVVFFALLTVPLTARDHWIELNIGPYYVSTDADEPAARDALNQLEQTRWVLGNLLESKDLRSLWPIRLLLTHDSTPTGAFVLQNGQYLWLAAPKDKLPLGDIAGLLLDANTPRLPADVESGLRALFSTLEAHGSRVTWGSPPARPDLAWARMQLFATKFEYSASFHIFLTALRGGSTLAAAERNAFGKSTAELEGEAQANLARGHWDPVPVNGRPLDPKRDFGTHILDPVIANVYLADCYSTQDPQRAESAYKAAVEAGGDSAALGYEGLASLANQKEQDPRADLDNAIRAGSRSAPVYLAAAQGLPASEALPLLKRAFQLNERWAEPLYAQAELAPTSPEKEALLKQGLQLDPRSTVHWIELAKLQSAAGQGTAAQGSWLRAEDSAPTEADRDHVHDLRLANEQQRLDADEAAQRREREAPHLADEQAQREEMARIHAAEQRANQATDQAAPSNKPTDAVPWDSLASDKKLSGLLTRVDCLKSGFRLAVKDKSGTVTQLYLSKDSGAQLACGPIAHPRRIALEYRAVIDDTRQTSGEVSTLTLQ